MGVFLIFPDMNKEKRIHLAFLILILVLGALLRLHQINSTSYSKDELSALIRLDYPNLSTLVKEGVKGDGHPAGVQVFLFYWVKAAGTSEWAVRLPFIFCSIAAIFLIWFLGKEWFGP